MSFGKPTKIQSRATVGPARSASDQAPEGPACLVSGTTTGLTQGFDVVLDALNATLGEWQSDPDFAAAGPGESLQRYVKGDRRVIVLLQNEPPAGTCENGPAGA